jgi:Family of unknown function (DUF5871)
MDQFGILKMDDEFTLVPEGVPKKNMFGGYFVSFKDPLLLVQSPKLKVLRTVTTIDKGSKSFVTVEADTVVSDWLSKIDDAILSMASAKWQDWFDSPKPEQIEAMFRYSTCFCEDTNATTFTLSINNGQRNGTDLFDKKCNPIDVQWVMDQNSATTTASLLVTCEGIWFKNQRFGPRFRLVQVKYHDL